MGQMLLRRPGWTWLQKPLDHVDEDPCLPRNDQLSAVNDLTNGNSGADIGRRHRSIIMEEEEEQNMEHWYQREGLVPVNRHFICYVNNLPQNISFFLFTKCCPLYQY